MNPAEYLGHVLLCDRGDRACSPRLRVRPSQYAAILTSCVRSQMPLHIERYELRADGIEGSQTFLLMQSKLLPFELPRIASGFDVTDDLARPFPCFCK